jgi:hypothetical protein
MQEQRVRTKPSLRWGTNRVSTHIGSTIATDDILDTVNMDKDGFLDMIRTGGIVAKS